MKHSKSIIPTALSIFTAFVIAGCEDDKKEKAQSTVAAAPKKEQGAKEQDKEKSPEEESREGQRGPGAIPDKAYGKYEVDPVHSMFVFRGDHFGLSYVYGMFNKVEGTFELKKKASESTVNLEIAADSLFSGHKKRDSDLKGPDFLNVKQYPKITFDSTKIEEESQGYEVTGDLTLHGKTKPVTLTMERVGSGVFPMDQSYRTGFHGKITIDRTNFGMDYLVDKGMKPKIKLIASVEGVKQ